MRTYNPVNETYTTVCEHCGERMTLRIVDLVRADGTFQCPACHWYYRFIGDALVVLGEYYRACRDGKKDEYLDAHPETIYRGDE